MNGPLHQTRIMAQESEADLIDIGALLGSLWRAKVPLALAGLLAGAATYALVSRVEPTYRAQAQVMLDPRQQLMINDENLIPQLTLSESVMASQVAVLRSNLLVERVAQDLDLAARPEFNPALVPPSLLSNAKAWIKGSLGLGQGREAPADPAKTESIRAAAVVRELQNRIGVAQDGISYVISISASSTDPELAAAIANTTANAFIAQQIEQRTAATEGATRWLDQRVTDLRAQVEAAEAAIAEFKANKLVLEGSTQEAASQQLLNLATQVSEARARQAATSARYDQARTLSEAGDLNAVASVADSAVIATLRTQRAELQRTIRQLSELYEPSDPRLTRARAELASLDDQILTETGSYIEGLRGAAEISAVELKNLEDNLLALEARILDLSQSAIELRQLEREADAVRDVYESLLARLKETRAIEEINVADARIVSRAEIPANPSAPRPGMLGALGAVLGVVAAAGFVLGRELWRRLYRSPAELEAATGLPVLAELPKLRGKPEQILAGLVANPQSSFAERVRDLRSALDLSAGGKAHKVVMLTSARPSEGKSTAVLALARITSLAGKKVIVVDADLRRPALNAVARPAPQGDLASILLGGGDWRQAVVRAEGAGFDILPTAAANARAADALALPAFDRLIDSLRTEYDLVLIDTPPVLAISDARTIAAKADMTLLVLRPDRTTAEAIRQALANLGHGPRSDRYAASRPQIAGFVLTMQSDARLRRLGGDYYG